MSKDTKEYIAMAVVGVLFLPAMMLYVKLMIMLGIWLGVQL